MEENCTAEVSRGTAGVDKHSLLNSFLKIEKRRD